MNRTARLILTAGVAVALSVFVSACMQSRVNVLPQFGMAYNSAMAAQIADPDVVYPTGEGTADGSRVGLAQTRYRTGTVTPPRVVDTTVALRGGASTTPR